MFDSEFKIGEIVSNDDIVCKYGCGNMGGMRRSHTTNTLVIISDYTKGIYFDKWIGGVLHYTGMGKQGNQDIMFAQNKTLAQSNCNDVDVHLFEVIDPGKYIYCGHVKLVDKPYIDIQPDENLIKRKVWIFPIKPVPDNDVIKPSGLVFKNLEDYKTNGIKADEEYLRTHNRVHDKKSGMRGRRVNHKIYGTGNVISIKDGTITVDFDKEGKKTLNYKLCLDNKIIEIL